MSFRFICLRWLMLPIVWAGTALAAKCQEPETNQVVYDRCIDHSAMDACSNVIDHKSQYSDDKLVGAHKALAFILRERHEYTAALVQLSSALDIVPSDRLLRRERAFMYLCLKQYGQARADYQRMGADPYSLALLDLINGDYDSVIALQDRQIASRGMHNAKTLSLLAIAFAGKRQFDIASRYLNAIIIPFDTLGINSSYTNYIHGRISEMNGDFEAALSHYDKMSPLFQNDANIYFHRAHALDELGRSEEARVNLAKARDYNPDAEACSPGPDILLRVALNTLDLRPPALEKQLLQGPASRPEESSVGPGPTSDQLEPKGHRP
jgi:tetratricopeptide (TPR) repeat protein